MCFCSFGPPSVNEGESIQERPAKAMVAFAFLGPALKRIYEELKDFVRQEPPEIGSSLRINLIIFSRLELKQLHPRFQF
jgi:hypothetical protein